MYYVVCAYIVCVCMYLQCICVVYVSKVLAMGHFEILALNIKDAMDVIVITPTAIPQEQTVVSNPCLCLR